MQLFLPQLKETTENHLAQPAQPGLWSDDQGGASSRRLGALAEAIVVPPGAKDVHSVPDPWARVILFNRALADPAHTLHRLILGEWRGLLAILGLRERMGFTGLSSAEVLLKPNGSPLLFSSVLGRVLPTEGGTLRAGDSWAHFYLLRWATEGATPQPIGFTSPVTLVATGASYPKAITEQEVPWFRRDQPTGKWLLTDPTPILSQAERKALAEWILTLHQQVGLQEPERGGWLLRLLQAFATELDSAIQQPGNERTLADRGIGLDYGIAALLDKPHNPETTILSDLLIETDVPDAPRLILVDIEAGAKLGRDPREIVVHRDITLASARARLPEFSRANSDFLDRQRAPDLRWCKPEYFFEPHLIYDQNAQSSSSLSATSDPFPGCRPVRVEGPADSRRILLPLTEEIMKLLTPETLQSSFAVEWKPDGSAICRLRLRVKSVNRPENAADDVVQGTRTIVITRAYPREQCVRIASLQPVGIWPNFRFPNDPTRWTRYYLFESWRGTTRTGDFIVRPPTRLYEANAPVTQKLGRSDDVFQIHRMSEYPQYLRCEMAPRENAEGYQVRPAGLMLLKEPESPRLMGNRTATLGIDFGTTGTSIYWAWLNDPQPMPVLFTDRLVPVTEYDHNDLRRITRDVFLPTQQSSSGRILSIYQVFQEPAPRELLDGHVLFESESGPGTFIAGDESGVRSDLKWGDDLQNEAAVGFLTQLCMQSIAELLMKGASSVAIRYSFPTAFSIEQKARFHGRWAGVRARLARITGIPLLNEGEQVENREAVAATRFFSNESLVRNLSVSQGAITIDIGGGTTDIALWSRDKDTRKPTLLSHLSVLYAGRDIFLEPVRRKPSVLVDLDPSIPIQSLTDRTPKTESYNAQLDALIADRGDDILKDLANRQDKVKDFLTIMSAGLCGLGFYSGLLAGRLIQAGAYRPGDLIPVFVGGNGSRLLSWCAINYFEPGMPIYDKFAACVLEGCRQGDPTLNLHVEIILSTKPKQEVAYGLVAQGLGSDGNKLAIGSTFDAPLGGENFFTCPGDSADWSASPTAAQLRAGTVAVDHALPVFHTFLKTAKINVGEDTLSKIAHGIDDRLGQISGDAIRMRDEDADKRAIEPLMKEPVFIMALKQLLNHQIAEWVHRG